jgi:hypothetical protein
MQIASRKPLWHDGHIPKDKTVLFLNVTSASMTARIGTCTLAPGSTSITIDWGDRTVEEYEAVAGATHTYAREGEYMVTISDDVEEFGVAGYGSTEAYNDMYAELANVAPKVKTISGYGFNNCHKMRGVINLPNVTTIGGYAFGTTLGITDFILPSMTNIVQTSFYAGPSPRQIHIDNAQRIDSRFFDYYGHHLADVYITGKTRSQIKSMSGFPFAARASVRFHGSDGIVMGDGTFA